MKSTALISTVLFCAAIAGCSSSQKVDDANAAATAPEQNDEVTTEPEQKSFEDPGPQKAATVEAFVTEWVSAKTSTDGTYDIPPQGAHDVSGEMGAFHTVHRSDEDTYYVCVDFEDGETVYDVDFFVDETDGGYTLADHYLHKIDGEDVTD